MNNLIDYYLKQYRMLQVSLDKSDWSVYVEKCINVIKRNIPDITLPEIKLVDSDKNENLYVKIGQKKYVLINANLQELFKELNNYSGYPSPLNSAKLRAFLCDKAISELLNRSKYKQSLFFEILKEKYEQSEHEFTLEQISKMKESYDKIYKSEKGLYKNDYYVNDDGSYMSPYWESMARFENISYFMNFIKVEEDKYGIIPFFRYIYEYQAIFVIMHELCHYLFEYYQEIGDVVFEERLMNKFSFLLKQDEPDMSEFENEKYKTDGKYEMTVESTLFSLREREYFQQQAINADIEFNYFVDELLYTDYKKWEEVYVDELSFHLINENREDFQSNKYSRVASDVDTNMPLSKREEKTKVEAEVENAVDEAILYIAYLQTLLCSKSYKYFESIFEYFDFEKNIIDKKLRSEILAKNLSYLSVRYFHCGESFLRDIVLKGNYEKTILYKSYEKIEFAKNLKVRNIHSILSYINTSVLDSEVLFFEKLISTINNILHEEFTDLSEEDAKLIYSTKYREQEQEKLSIQDNNTLIKMNEIVEQLFKG